MKFRYVCSNLKSGTVFVAQGPIAYDPTTLNGSLNLDLTTNATDRHRRGVVLS